MTGRRRRSGALKATLALFVVVAVVVAGLATWRSGLLDDLFEPEASPSADPASVPAPESLDLPPVAEPDPVAEPVVDGATGPELARPAVRRVLAPYLDDRDLGPHVLAEVAPLDGDRAVYERGRGTAIPASTTKLVTTTAALLALGADHRFTTSVVADQGRSIVLVGGGDPFLARAPRADDGSVLPYPARADIVTLAQQAADALRRDGVRSVTIGYDDSLFTGPQVNATWESDYVSSGEVSPTSALWVDEGRSATVDARVDPARDAAQAFADALAGAGIRVRGTPSPRLAPDGAATIADVESAPLSEIVQRILEVSDNDGAEVLLRHVGVATSGRGSIAAGRRGLVELMQSAGVRMRASVLYDGSGLSREGRLDPSTLVDVLQLAAQPDEPELRSVVSGLPVAGFTGSLADRMDAAPPAGLGRVRAKTGTLSSVSSLAGLALDLDGRPMVFVLMADRIAPLKSLDARQTLDSAAGALGACGCAR